MPRLSTAIVLTSFGVWRWQDVGIWILRRIVERIWIEYQIYQLKTRFRLELWYILILVLPALLSVVGLIASLVVWILYIVVILVKLLAQSTIFFADWVIESLVAQKGRNSALSFECATTESYTRRVHHSSEDRSTLTFKLELEAGCFVLVARGNEWDEVLLVAHFEGSEWLGYTTTPDGSRFMWTLLKLTLGNFRVVEGRDAARGPPGGILAQQVNWVCDPMSLGTKWAPTAPQMVTLCGEGRVILDIVKSEPTSPVRHVAGTAADLVELIPGRHGAQGAPPSSSQDGALGPPVQTDSMELQKLAEVVNSIRNELKEKSSRKDKKKKKSRSRSSSRKAKKSKKKKKKRSRSGSSSNSSSMTSSGSSYVRWKHQGKNKKVDAVAMGKVDTRRFKKRSDLLIFAAKHPGALTANFINGIRQKLMKGGILKTGQLRDVELTEYVSTGAAGFKEVRDRREAMTILQVMDYINQQEIEKAMDVLSMRLTALIEAKSTGGTWDKASKKELIPEEGSSLAPAGLSGMA